MDRRAYLIPISNVTSSPHGNEVEECSQDYLDKAEVDEHSRDPLAALMVGHQFVVVVVEQVGSHQRGRKQGCEEGLVAFHGDGILLKGVSSVGSNIVSSTRQVVLVDSASANEQVECGG